VNHLPILPVLIPMAGAAVSLIVEHRRFGTGVRRLVAWCCRYIHGLMVIFLVYKFHPESINMRWTY